MSMKNNPLGISIGNFGQIGIASEREAMGVGGEGERGSTVWLNGVDAVSDLLTSPGVTTILDIVGSVQEGIN